VVNLNQLRRQIYQLKKERNAIILAHYYQRPEIQDAADLVGDSFALSLEAAQTDAEIIVFCGVRFMAETASILSPDKIVLLPDLEACCPMAEMAVAEDLVALKEKHPHAAVVSYVNTSAAVKAESDICCTSANALQVVESLPHQTIIFCPDRNMGRYVAARTKKEVILWDGYCATHDHLTAEDILAAKQRHPRAVVMVHPECRPEVTELADYILGTRGMLELVSQSSANAFIVGTEAGLSHALYKAEPEKTYIFPSSRLICPTMKLNALERVLEVLETLEPRITVPADIQRRARKALDKMLAVR